MFFLFFFLKILLYFFFFFFSSRRRHTRLTCDWSSDVCSSDLRPIATLDSLRFGELDSRRSRYLLDHAVAGIGHYGNSIGVATVGGEIYFEGPYEHNCLINAMCLGIGPRERLVTSAAAGIGN